MGQGADRQGRARAFAALLIALALFARILVPEGWMPDATGHGLVLCTGSGPMMAPMGARMAMAAMPSGAMHHRKGDDAKGEHPCIFSNLSAALATPGPLPAPLLPAETIAGPIALLLGLVAIGHGLAAPPPPPTGPPSIVRSERPS